MKLPTWTELSENQQDQLINLATPFAVGPDDAIMPLPTIPQARCIAMEMYDCSRMVIEEVNEP